jgi:hypothetical protein
MTMPSLKRKVGGLLRRLLGGAASAGKAAPDVKRKVWRISERSPGGEWVDADSAPTPLPDAGPPSERSSSGWLTSSMDLLSGAEVVEDPDIAPASARDEPRTLPLRGRSKDPKK